MKALRFLMVLCLSFVLTNKMSYGQEAYIDRWYSSPFFNRLTSDDGLSSPIINAIHQDFLGFMWFGTANGLDRYDGYEIRSYRYDMDNPETISNNTVVEIFEDSKHRFWVGTTNGLNLYNREKNRFIRMTHSPENQQTITHNQIEGIEEDTEGNIWIATYNGLNRWNESDSTFTRFLMSPDEDDAFSKIHSLLVDQSGDLWIGTQFGGLCKFNRSTGICDEVYINKSDDPNSIPSNFVWDLFEDKSGNFFVSTFNQDVSLFDRKTGLFNNLRSLPKGDSTIDQSHAWVIEEGIDGKTWFGMANRLLIWDGDVVNPNKFISIKENPNDRERSISSSNILSIFRSENGIVWVGSRSGGVNYISKRDIRFFRYNNRSDGSVLNKVSSFAQNKDGLIWIGTDGGGISILDEDKNVVRPFKTKSTPLKSDAILSILPDDQGMWIGGWAGGVCYYDNITEDIEYYITDICSTSIDNVFDIKKDSKGVLWIATWDDGLISYDPSSKQCTMFNSSYDDSMGISGNDITAVYVDSQDRIWISIYGLGFDVYDQNTQTFEHFQPVNTVNGLANDNIINCFREGIHGEMWIGSQGSGLLKFDIETGDFTPFKSILGLPKDEVNSLVVRENGIIWMGTNFGLYQFNPYTMEVNHYDKTAGVIGNNLGLNSALLTSKEGMYFGGLNGMNYFHPDSLQQNKEETALLFTDFKVFNKTIDLSQSESNGKDITVNDQINLSYKASVFSICFAALNYQNTANCTYKYKLVGFDKDWSITNAQNRTVTYTNLDAGEYDFQVLATNSDGKWNNTPASIKIFISPPFWETYWFRIAVIILILGTGIAIHSFRLRYLNQRNVILENEITERTKEIKAKNDALIEAVDELKSTQTQLIVSEKMAALGQLTASVSHEVNTPLGTINSAVDSIKANFPQVIEQLPELTKLLNDKQLKAFMVILKNAENAPSISTQETRRFKKAMRAKLDEMGIRESNMLSSYLNHLNTDVNSQECLTLLKHKDVLKIFDIASKIVNINNLTGNISASVQQASKVAFALKKYSHSSYNHSNEKIDLKENILSVFTIFKNQLQQVKVNLDIPDGVHITGRPSELSQVWLNLIQNAVHALKGIGEIDILVQPNEEKVITSIKDNGTGIPKDIQEKVFDPFFTTKPYGQGSGLGLDIVNKIISKHQGTITFESNNSGTVFKVELPYESERE